jgi:hypothetical protein
MLSLCNPRRQFIPFRFVAAEQTRKCNVLVNRSRRGLADIHHIQDGGGVPAAHHLSVQGHDRNVVDQAFQNGIATGPADAIQHDVTQADCGDEAIRCQSRQENTMFGGVKTDRLERAFEPISKHLGDASAPAELDKCKLTIANLGCDACENSIKLRQIFRQ